MTHHAGAPGIAIDRLDYSEFFNYDYDDNVSWIPRNGTAEDGLRADLTIWGPARALRLSYRHTFNRLHESLHPTAVLAEKELKEAENAAGKASAAEEALVGNVKAEPADKMMLNNCTCVASSPPAYPLVLTANQFRGYSPSAALLTLSTGKCKACPSSVTKLSGACNPIQCY